jgi:hypothetical protein
MGFLKNMRMVRTAYKAADKGHGAQGLQAGGVGDIEAGAAYPQLAARLYESGVDAKGVVHSVRPTGETDISNNPWVEFDVSIKPADGEPYQTTIKQLLPPHRQQGPSEGKAISVKYDPDSPTTALIVDW